MNEEIILTMVRPYLKNKTLTYDEFDNIFSMLSHKEQYEVCEILFNNDISLVDTVFIEKSHEDDSRENFSSQDFEILYDKNLFKDNPSVNGISKELIINKNIRQSNEILCHLIQDGNRQAAQDLCIKNSGLVNKYATLYEKRYRSHVEFEDLQQVGFLGLIKAAEKFDISQGTAFSTYAVYWIKQAIAREIMLNGYAIRIPVHMMERINKVTATDRQLAEKGLSLFDRISCISEEFGLSDDNVKECLVLKRNYLSYTSLDIPVGEDKDMLLGDIIPIGEDESVEKIVFHRELRQEIDKVIASLRPKEQEVLKLRFGWDDNRPKTLEEISKKYNVTRERIRQIEVKALQRLQCCTQFCHLKDFWEE